MKVGTKWSPLNLFGEAVRLCIIFTGSRVESLKRVDIDSLLGVISGNIEQGNVVIHFSEWN